MDVPRMKQSNILNNSVSPKTLRSDETNNTVSYLLTLIYVLLKKTLIRKQLRLQSTCY